MAYKSKKTARAYGKKWYYANKEKRVKQIKTWQKKQGQKVCDYKLNKGCSVCGYKKCVKALDFHHIYGDKKFTIASASHRGKSFKTIMKEVKKCKILCKNCHAEHHADVAQLARATVL